MPDTSPASPRPRSTWPRRAIVVAVMLAIVFGVPLTVYQVSVQPGAALVKLTFESGQSVHAGPGVALERPGVTATTGIEVPVGAPGAPEVPPATLDVYAPKARGPYPVILWIHGGGFIANSSADVAPYATVLADAGYVVAALDYSLAPGARYPTPVVQANAALAWLTANAGDFGGDPARIVIGGDSAGAQIASQVAVTESSAAFAERVGVVPASGAGLRGVVLFCGLYDMTTVAGTGFPALRTFLWAYTGSRDWLAYPRIDELSTTTTATAEYPPTYVAVGDADPFASQGRELADALTSRGVEVRTQFWDGNGLGHEYQFDFRLPEARETLTATLAFLAEVTR